MWKSAGLGRCECAISIPGMIGTEGGLWWRFCICLRVTMLQNMWQSSTHKLSLQLCLQQSNGHVPMMPEQTMQQSKSSPGHHRYPGYTGPCSAASDHHGSPSHLRGHTSHADRASLVHDKVGLPGCASALHLMKMPSRESRLSAFKNSLGPPSDMLKQAGYCASSRAFEGVQQSDYVRS